MEINVENVNNVFEKHSCTLQQCQQSFILATLIVVKL